MKSFYIFVAAYILMYAALLYLYVLAYPHPINPKTLYLSSKMTFILIMTVLICAFSFGVGAVYGGAAGDEYGIGVGFSIALVSVLLMIAVCVNL